MNSAAVDLSSPGYDYTSGPDRTDRRGSLHGPRRRSAGNDSGGGR